jgi:molecular chaperone DnaK (HSP70)
MDPSKSRGAWIGIDLGTTNCTAAVWDLNSSSPKVLRLTTLARPVDSGKGGKIVPSVVTFFEDGSTEAASVLDDAASGEFSTLVGYQALQCADQAGELLVGAFNQATVTSFKRVVGMTSRQAKELQASDPDFWNSLPFQTIILDGVRAHQDLSNTQTLDMLGAPKTKPSDLTPKVAQEGVAIRIQPLPFNPLHDKLQNISRRDSSEYIISPLQVTTILLQSIRNAADAYLTKNKSIRPPSIHVNSNECNDHTIQNCIIGVPAHYSHTQRIAIQTAAKNAGFNGYIGVMTESTAAAMSYGLFVSPNVKCEDREKRILVFDMGGGTTDVTIAVMDGDTSADNGDVSENGVKFQVVATAGDRCLGGDNVDELLARYLWNKMNSSTERREWQASEHHEFIQKCRNAKEQLCGNDKEDQEPLSKTQLTMDGVKVDVTRDEFETAIKPIVDRAEAVVNEALSQMKSSNYSVPIHEVVLVGGSSHIPIIREMLRRKFPPPIPPDLCTSISAETAVAQGLAIQSALVSGVVPLWELRNAMMLDALPHSIGVWIDPDIPNDGSGAPYEKGDILHGSESRGHYVEILEKDAPLPAKGSATFTLANIDQFGVTVVAVERIGVDTYQCMGVFTFLLHRLDLQLAFNNDPRQIEVGMTLESNGKFVVSVFDENDPEHRERKRAFLQQKGIESECGGDDGDRVGFTGTEASLIILIAIAFALYVGTRIAFSEVELDLQDNTDEL